jgi:hypothetical protein
MDKPNGFDFRDRHSDKTGSGRDWTPADAVYSASLGVASDAKAALIVWADASGAISYRQSGGAEWAALLAAKFLQVGI